MIRHYLTSDEKWIDSNSISEVQSQASSALQEATHGNSGIRDRMLIESSELQLVTVLRGVAPASPTYSICLKRHKMLSAPLGFRSIFLRRSTKIREKATRLHRSLTYLGFIIAVREPPVELLATNSNPVKISVQNIWFKSQKSRLLTCIFRGQSQQYQTVRSPQQLVCHPVRKY